MFPTGHEIYIYEKLLYMKSIRHVMIFMLFSAFFLSSCLKPNHSLRIKNEYSSSLKVVVGPNDYGTISPGSTTEYKSIPEGSHNISGGVVGSVSISGKGTHKWTITIGSGGTVSAKED